MWYTLLSGLCVVFALLCFFVPGALDRLNHALNQTVTAVDERLMRSRHVMGVLLLIAAACFFYLAHLL